MTSRATGSFAFLMTAQSFAAHVSVAPYFAAGSHTTLSGKLAPRPHPR